MLPMNLILTRTRRPLAEVSVGWTRLVAVLAAVLTFCAWTPIAMAQTPLDSIGARIDPYEAKQRVLVLTDIANEPDDQMSLVRFLVYANHYDVEGLVATTSTWLRDTVRVDVIQQVIDAYEQIQPNLLLHEEGFPPTAALRSMVRAGQAAYGMEAVGSDKMTPGAALIIEAADKDDVRPLWVTVWGGANTLAQALFHVQETRSSEEVEQFISKLRVYTISDQDDAGPWLRRTFPTLHYIATPSTQNGEEYGYATWTGISGDLFYRNAPGADFTTFSDAWIDENIRSKGPLGANYPQPCCIHEGDTPSFLGLIDNGLASAMSPAFGGWGGRYVWRQYYGETRPHWTQGGDNFPGNGHSKDTVIGRDGHTYTSDQATIWRWREAFQNDFAARMDWTVKPANEANHNPEITVNGQDGKAPLMIDAQVGVPVTLDASETSDPDGDGLSYTWFFYPEAATGIPGRPVLGEGFNLFQTLMEMDTEERTIGLRRLPDRVTIQDANSATATVTPQVAGIAHVILEVTDDGTPNLTSYRRIILHIQPASD